MQSYPVWSQIREPSCTNGAKICTHTARCVSSATRNINKTACTGPHSSDCVACPRRFRSGSQELRKSQPSDPCHPCLDHVPTPHQTQTFTLRPQEGIKSMAGMGVSAQSSVWHDSTSVKTGPDHFKLNVKPPTIPTQKNSRETGEPHRMLAIPRATGHNLLQSLHGRIAHDSPVFV